MASRGRSVPPEKVNILDASITELDDKCPRGPIILTPMALTPSPVTTPAGLSKESFLRADRAAKMHYEMSIRALNHSMEKSKLELARLVRATENNDDFRKDHEKRLQEYWHEMLIVKEHASKINEDQRAMQVTQTEIQTWREEISLLIADLKAEVAEVKAITNGHYAGRSSSNESGYSSQHMENTMQPTQHVIHRQNTTDSQLSWLDTSPFIRSEQEFMKSHGQTAGIAANRVRQIIRSTRRWNHDYKTTTLTDSAFCMDFLNQQAKNDKVMAVYIQKAIKRRVRHNDTNKHTPVPKSLGEFCKSLTWEDITETIRDLLVENERTALLDIM